MSSAVMPAMVGRGMRFWQTTVGKKAVMAVTGFILFGFVVGHLLGNLQIFISPERLNHYAELLKSAPALLWGVRLTLLASVALHMWAAISLTLLDLSARPIRYYRKANVNSSYASRTMIWGGVIIGAFVVFHLLHFTTGSVHPQFSQKNVYNNVVIGFQAVPVAVFYIIAMVLLCLHLYHGLWSMFQSLGLEHPTYTPWIKRFAKLFAIAIAAGNISIPAAVLAGVLKPVAGD
jgi:succinate dehydrogenase / fumarate reductase cytochrome b subunit